MFSNEMPGSVRYRFVEPDRPAQPRPRIADLPDAEYERARQKLLRGDPTWMNPPDLSTERGRVATMSDVEYAAHRAKVLAECDAISWGRKPTATGSPVAAGGGASSSATHTSGEGRNAASGAPRPLGADR